MSRSVTWGPGVGVAGRMYAAAPASRTDSGRKGALVHKGLERRVTEDLCELAERALSGDQQAWNRMVDRFAPLVWSVARSFGLSAADAAEVSQTTWMRLAEHLGGIEQRERIGAWLVTTARREALRVRRLGDKTIAIDDVALDLRLGSGPSADEALLTRVRDDVCADALRRLPERLRVLLVMLMSDPPASYQDVSAALGIAVGSIGPTRGRALAQLRQIVEDQGYALAD